MFPGALSNRPSFRLEFLGKQSLNRPNGTGFGSVQKSLRSLYLAHVATGNTHFDKQFERTVIIDENELHFRYWDSRARQFQQDSYPFDSVTYLDLVFFQTVKGKKHYFGYFRRRSDATDVIPDSVLIPLHKKDHKLLTKMPHKPLICMVLRRPFGVQFLECHLFAAEAESVGLDFIQEFDVKSRLRHEPDPNSGSSFNPAPWFDRDARRNAGRWQSQPTLVPDAGMTFASNMSEPLESPESTASRMTPTPRPPIDDRVPESPSITPAAPIRRAVSGTIFDKYKELQQFVISDYDYMRADEIAPPALPPRRRPPPADRQSSFAERQAALESSAPVAPTPVQRQWSLYASDMQLQSRSRANADTVTSKAAAPAPIVQRKPAVLPGAVRVLPHAPQLQLKQPQKQQLQQPQSQLPQPQDQHHHHHQQQQQQQRQAGGVNPHRINRSPQQRQQQPQQHQQHQWQLQQQQRPQQQQRQQQQQLSSPQGGKDVKLQNASIHHQLDGINFQGKVPIDFSTALGYLP